jgi:hypothetical protein
MSMSNPKENIEEAAILVETAKNLFDQSEVLMKQARALRAESMNLRKLALQLDPSKATVLQEEPFNV